MNPAILLLALTAVPLGIASFIEFRSQSSPRALYGMIGAGWSMGGVLLIVVGVPGIIFFPGLIGIMLFGTLMQLRQKKERLQYVKAGLLTIICGSLAVWMVFL